VPKGVLPKRHRFSDWIAPSLKTLPIVAAASSCSSGASCRSKPLHASRAARIEARDSPGGEPKWLGKTAPATGVAGIVSSKVFPKRHRLVALPQSSLQDTPEELSVSEALLWPTSVVSSSSRNCTLLALDAICMESAGSALSKASIVSAMSDEKCVCTSEVI
jgi:hypothetical protein